MRYHTEWWACGAQQTTLFSEEKSGDIRWTQCNAVDHHVIQRALKMDGRSVYGGNSSTECQRSIAIAKFVCAAIRMSENVDGVDVDFHGMYALNDTNNVIPLSGFKWNGSMECTSGLNPETASPADTDGWIGSIAVKGCKDTGIPRVVKTRGQRCRRGFHLVRLHPERETDGELDLEQVAFGNRDIVVRTVKPNGGVAVAAPIVDVRSAERLSPVKRGQHVGCMAVEGEVRKQSIGRVGDGTLTTGIDRSAAYKLGAVNRLDTSCITTRPQDKQDDDDGSHSGM